MIHREQYNTLKIGISLILLLLFGIHTALSQVPMTTSEADALKEKVKALSRTTKTISSDFVQYKHLDFLSNDIESKGKLVFKTPDKIRWEYVSPFAYVVIFKDESLYINDNGNKSSMDMGSNAIFKQLNQLITASIKGNLFEASEFKATYLKIKEKSEVHFEPTDPQFREFIKSFQITFDDTGEVQEVKMIEPSEDYTQIIFDNRTTNQTISDAVFDQ